MIYHGYELLTDGVADMYVDPNPVEVLKHLAADVCIVSNKRIEGVTVGTVEANSIENALNQIRMDNWIQDDTFSKHGSPDE